MKILLSGIEMEKFIIFSISVGIPFGPVPLEQFRSAISRKTSFGVQGSNTKVESFLFFRYLSKVFRIGVLFFFKILSATVEK